MGQKKRELDVIAEKIISSNRKRVDTSSLIIDYQNMLNELRELEKNIASTVFNNIRDENGNTKAHLAAQTGNIAVIQKIKVEGGDLNILNFEGDSPLHLAVKKKKREMIEELSKQDANLETKNSRNETALE